MHYRAATCPETWLEHRSATCPETWLEDLHRQHNQASSSNTSARFGRGLQPFDRACGPKLDAVTSKPGAPTAQAQTSHMWERTVLCVSPARTHQRRKCGFFRALRQGLTTSSTVKGTWLVWCQLLANVSQASTCLCTTLRLPAQESHLKLFLRDLRTSRSAYKVHERLPQAASPKRQHRT